MGFYDRGILIKNVLWHNAKVYQKKFLSLTWKIILWKANIENYKNYTILGKKNQEIWEI